jgi:NitT/TauT family transport system substrate-binding protein
MTHHTAFVFLAVALLAGCGDHRSAEKPTIRFATTRGALLDFPVYLAQSLGYYDQEGIAVSLQEFSGAPKSMQSLLGGTTDIVCGGFTAVVMMNAQGRAVQAFDVLLRYSAFVGLVSPAAKKPIARIGDLDGATVGVSSPGSDQQLILNFICARNHINPSHVKVVGVGAGASSAMALERGTIDAGVDAGMVVSVIKKRHPGTAILFDLRSAQGVQKYLGFNDLAHVVLYAKTDWIREHPDSLKGIVRATSRASEWARSHSPGQIREHLPASLLNGDSEVDLDAIGSLTPLLSPDGAFRPEHLEAARKIIAASNESMKIGQADLSGAYTNKFVHMSVQ